MNCIANERFYLTSEELYVLLNAYKIKKWYGFDISDDIKTLNDVNRVIAELYRKDIVKWENKKAVVLPPFDAFFNVIKNSRHCICKVSSNSEESVKMYYLHGKNVALFEAGSRKGEYLISMMSKGDLKINFENDGIFPEEIEPFENIDSLPSDYSDYGDKSPDECFKKGDVVCLLEKVDINSGKTVERVIIQDKGLTGFMYISNKSGSVCYPCRADTCCDVMDNLFAD